MKHYQIAVRGGCADSLCRIRELYSNGETDKKTHSLAVLTLAVAGEGDKETIEKLNELYSDSSNTATKEDYHNALRSYQVYLSEIKSSQRDKWPSVQAHQRNGGPIIPLLLVLIPQGKYQAAIQVHCKVDELLGCG